MRTEFYGATDTGKKRKNNEDSYLVQEQLALYAVADGIGGNEGGEVASRIAVDVLESAVPDLLGQKDRTPPSGLSAHIDLETAALRHAFVLANQEIRREKKADSAFMQMGTTLTAFLFAKERAFIGHIGDSRAYLFRKGRLGQITNDHSIVAEQVRAGILTAAQARSNPRRHIITRALGIEDDLKAEFSVHEVRPNDTILLCTDGLTEMVDEPVIEKMLTGCPPREAVQKLVKAANERGGVDNITVVVVRFS